MKRAIKCSRDLDRFGIEGQNLGTFFENKVLTFEIKICH